MALTLNGKKKKLKLSDFDLLAKSLYIPPTAVKNSYQKFLTKNNDVHKMIFSSFLSPKNKQLYLEIWNKKSANI